MKSILSSLFLSFCFVVLPSNLLADTKTVSEADAAAPISITKGDTLTFSLNDTAWTYTALAGIFSDPTVQANDPQATLLSWSSTSTNSTLTGSSISVNFKANNSGQLVFLFTQTGADPVYKYSKAITFVINIKDPVSASPNTGK